MDRRDFLRSAGIATAGLVWPGARASCAPSSSPGGAWRTFEIVTRAEVLDPSGPTRVWIPLPLAAETPYQKAMASTFKADGGTAKLVPGTTLDSVAFVAADFPAGVKPVLIVTSRASTRNYDVDLAVPRRGRRDRAALGHFLRPTKLLPIDGVVRDRARVIVGAARTDEDKARAIYDWIVENTFRDPKVRGCGRGDIRSMLETGNLGGKCADLNALYVGLSRAAGIPARDVYGSRTV